MTHSAVCMVYRSGDVDPFADWRPYNDVKRRIINIHSFVPQSRGKQPAFYTEYTVLQKLFPLCYCNQNCSERWHTRPSPVKKTKTHKSAPIFISLAFGRTPVHTARARYKGYSASRSLFTPQLSPELIAPPAEAWPGWVDLGGWVQHERQSVSVVREN